MKKVTAKLIRSLNPCYDPIELGNFEGLELTPIEFIDQFKDKVKNKKDIIWVLCHECFMTEKDLRLYAVWNAREALKLTENPDKRIVNACNVAERYAMGKATEEELIDAHDAADDAVVAAVAAAAVAAADADAAYAAAVAAAAVAADADAAYAAVAAVAAADADAAYAAVAAAYAAFIDLQINKLRTYFKQETMKLNITVESYKPKTYVKDPCELCYLRRNLLEPCKECRWNSHGEVYLLKEIK